MLLSESGASTSFYYGLNQKILTTTATTLTTYLGDKPIDSHRLIASGFLKVVMQETEVKIFLDNERQNIIELWIKPTF